MANYQYISHSPSAANRYTYATSNITDEDTGKIVFYNNMLIGVASGDVYKGGKNNILRYEILTENRTWYIDTGSVAFGNDASQNYLPGARNELNQLLENQLVIMDLLNVSAAMTADLEYKGRNMDTQRKAIRYYYERLMQRNADLIDGGVLENVQTGTTELTGRYGNYLEKIAKDQRPLRIGIAPLVPIIIKATIIVAVAVIAYMIVRSIFVESKTDLKEAKDLANTIAGMDKDTAKQYIKYLDKLTGSGFMTQLKWIAIVGGTAFVAYHGLNYLQKGK